MPPRRPAQSHVTPSLLALAHRSATIARMKTVPPGFAREIARAITEAGRRYSAAAGRATAGLDAAELVGELSRDVLGELCEAVRVLSYSLHALKFRHDWGLPPTPEWHDHFLDQEYQFRKDRVSFWLERWIYSTLALKQDSEILELCCGDGYGAYHFYSTFARRLVAADFELPAIEHASRYNAAENIEYRHCDIRAVMPTGPFDNVIWDGAIEHFTEAEIAGVLRSAKAQMKPNAILSGYTVVEKGDGEKHLHQHEREFRDKADLASLLTPHFKNVRVFETIHPLRHNLYFWCSDGAVPFDADWPHGLSVRRGWFARLLGR